MADPLSISASIAGLVALADLIFRSGTKYAKGYKGAQKEVENLMREVKDLSVILHNLELVAFDLEETESLDPKASHEQHSSLQLHHLHHCRQLLRRLETGLSRTDSCIRSNSSLERLQTRMKWPFTSTESKDMIIEVQRYKQIIDTALAVDSLAKLNLCLSQQTEIKNKLDGVQQTTDKILDIQVKIVLDAKRDKVLKDFGKVNPRQEYETNRKLRHGLTGLWLTQGADFSDWYSTPGAKLWCSGIPGGGKSVLAASIVEECLQRNGKDPDKAVAYFFCTYRELPSQDPCSILSSLCMQLALQNEEAFEILQEAHDELYNSYLHTQPTSERLTEVLERISDCFNRVYLIIDGLDECGDHTEASVMSLAQLAASQKGDVINIALLSRDEVAIRQIIEEDFEHIEIEARTEDVQLYVASELSQRIIKRRLRIRDPTLKDLIMTRLIEGAKGMFRWVACQLDHMCELPTDKARRKALDKLPPTLFATYDRILMKIEDYDEQVKQIVKKTLLLLVASSSISSRELCESISLDEDANTLEEDDIVSEEDLLTWCSSLVRTTEVHVPSGTFRTEIEFAHFTVREYLDSLHTRPFELEYIQLRKYALPPHQGFEFHTCIYLRFLTMDIIEKDTQTYNLAQTIYSIIEENRVHETYFQAAYRWSSYFKKGVTMGGLVHQLVQKLLIHKTPNFCLWAVAFIFQLRSAHLRTLGQHPNAAEVLPLAINTVLRPDFTTLHMAAAFHMEEICQELLESGSSPDLCSNFGPPLHFAVGGWAIFLDPNFNRTLLSSQVNDFLSTHRLQTVKCLLSRGAKLKSEVKTPFCLETILCLALLYPERFFLILQVVRLLIEAHASISYQDMKLFERFYDSPQTVQALQSYAELSTHLGGLVESLGDACEPGTPRFILRQKTLDLDKRIWKTTSEQRVSNSTDMRSTEEVLAHIVSLINLNDKDGMEAFLATERSGLIRSSGLDPEHPDYSALHIAVSVKSLDIIESLLTFGLDARSKAQNNVTPIHLCDEPSSRKALSALLRYAKSSLDTDSSGETVWHRAARKNALDVLELLLHTGEADTALKMASKGGKTPMSVAASNLHDVPDTFGLLIIYCETNRCFESKEFYKYFAGSESLLTIIRDGKNRFALEDWRKHRVFSQAPAGMRKLEKCFQLAMKQEDVDSCEKLLKLGCPTEFDIGAAAMTPFALAIWNNQERMIEWFCAKRARISTVIIHPEGNHRCTALELALERPKLNQYLRLLIERYLEEEGDFSHMHFSLLSIPILHSNEDGLLILLEVLEGKTLGPEEFAIEIREREWDRVTKYVTRAGTLSAMVHQRDCDGETALHRAVHMDSLEAAKALIYHGAEVDAINHNIETPLHLAVYYGFYQIARLLIERGAQLDQTIAPSGQLILLACRKYHWELVELLLDAGEVPAHATDSGRNLLNLMTWTESPDNAPNVKLFCRFLDLGVDLYTIDTYGLSAFQHLFLERCPVYLRAALDRYSQLDFDRLEGWPEIYFHEGIRTLVSTTRNFRYVSRRLTKNGILQLCGLARTGSHSLLCRAACWNSVEAINNIIKLGVKDLEHHCTDHGTPLEAAILHRRFEAVKSLVRNGALIPRDLGHPKDLSISLTNPDFVIRQWLFIGRFTERKRLLGSVVEQEVEMKNWSGVWAAQVTLPFDCRKGVDESTLDYAKRRKWILSGNGERSMRVRRLAQLKRHKFEGPSDR